MTPVKTPAKKYAASKYFLQICEKVYRGVNDDMNYTHHDTREAAVQYLIDREEKAIELAEKGLKRAQVRLREFKKKEKVAVVPVKTPAKGLTPKIATEKP